MAVFIRYLKIVPVCLLKGNKQYKIYPRWVYTGLFLPW